MGRHASTVMKINFIWFPLVMLSLHTLYRIYDPNVRLQYCPNPKIEIFRPAVGAKKISICGLGNSPCFHQTHLGTLWPQVAVKIFVRTR